MPKEPSTIALTPDLAPTPGTSGGRRPPPTREEELELAKRIEQANGTLIDSLVDSGPALQELVRIAAELRDGVVDASELTTKLAHGKRDDEQVGAALIEAIERFRSSAGLAGAPCSVVDVGCDGTARADVVRALTECGLSSRAIARVLAELTALGDARRGATRPPLAESIERIQRNVEELKAAKATFMEANMGLVYWMAGKRGNTLMPFHDLVQEGALGLMRAVDTFDYRRGVRFNTYAVWWIRHALNRALSDQPRTIRIPVHVLEARHTVLRTAREFVQQQGREPTEAELSQCSGIPVEKIRAVSSIPPEPVSMDAPLGAESDTCIGERIADPRQESSLDAISAREHEQALRRLLQTLSPREQEVLRLRFGFDRVESLTFEQIGRRFSLSRERIRQIEVEALSKLRQRASAEGLDGHFTP